MLDLTWTSGTATAMNDKSNGLVDKYSTYATVNWTDFLEGTSTTSIPYQQWINGGNGYGEAINYGKFFKGTSKQESDTKKDEEKENKEMAEMNNVFNNMFGKVPNGMCRLSMYGGIAVKTSNGYKTYNLKKNRLTNCSNFVFPVGEEFFFVIPTNKVEVGDIILIANKPKCVISTGKDTIQVINYEDSVVETILPERHIFMGNAYFYGKIVSMFGDDIVGNGKKGMNKLVGYMMMSEMMKGSGNNNSMASMLPLMMLTNGGSFGDMFSDIFNFAEEDEDDCSDIEDGGIREA